MHVALKAGLLRGLMQPIEPFLQDVGLRLQQAGGLRCSEHSAQVDLGQEFGAQVTWVWHGAGQPAAQRSTAMRRDGVGRAISVAWGVIQLRFSSFLSRK